MGRVFSKLQAFQYHFPDNLGRILKFYESEIFSDSFLHRIFKSENSSGFLFLRKIA